MENDRIELVGVDDIRADPRNATARSGGFALPPGMVAILVLTVDLMFVLRLT